MNKNYKKVFTISLLVIAIICIVYFVYSQFWKYDPEKKKEDIYYIWLEGKRIVSGENPYERILSGNMRENLKYPTLFPLFYLLIPLTDLAGLRNFHAWIFFWRFIFLLFNIGIALILFYIFYQYEQMLIGLFASLFWLLNRWTLYVAMIAQNDFIAIFFLIFSLFLFSKNKWLSLVFFSLSLATKQIAIFLFPLYIIWIWNLSDKNAMREVLRTSFVIISIPLGISLPFIFLNAEGFLKSILFSATRNPAMHVEIPSLDVLLGFIGIPAKLPMFFMMALIFLCALKNRIGKYTSVLFTMVVFVFFNSVFLMQYFCWVVPFIPLSVCDMIRDKQQGD